MSKPLPKIVKQKLPFDLVMVDPRTLSDNPLNWKKHPSRQRQAFKALKESVGFVGMAIYNRTTRRLLDGHMRKDEAIKAGEAIPVAMVDWSEEQEKVFLAQFDPIGSLAETNAAALANLAEASDAALANLTKLSAGNRKALAQLNTDLTQLSTRIEAGDSAISLQRSEKRRRNLDEKPSHDTHSVRSSALADDVIFPIENEFGIPTLDSDRLCTTPPKQTWDRSDSAAKSNAWYCYSAGRSTLPDYRTRRGGVLGFFCEDWRFEVAWNDTPDFTESLLAERWSAVVLPDYSTWTDWPPIVCLHNIYRSRWLGRYWQEAGIKVLPILQNCGASDALTEHCISVLPNRIPVAAIQCRTNDGTTGYWRAFTNLISLACSIIKIECLVIYGGAEHYKSFSSRLPKGPSYVMLDSFVARRRGR